MSRATYALTRDDAGRTDWFGSLMVRYPTEMSRHDIPVRTLARLARILEHSCGDLTIPQYRLMAMIGEGSERATLLAGRLALTKPSVSGMIDALVDRGFVTRTPEPTDRRAARLALTPSGTRALRASERSMAERLDPIIDGCDDPAAITTALTQIEASLNRVVDARLAAKGATGR
ncbi:MAG: transcriptional regulator, MarR family [Actinomycetia bacterium]|nr:transcriptional regulator, MarR family [Actinomycetes bacterium]